MSTVFTLPDVGEGLTEADIVTWKVAVGDEVTVNQILVEIETAKSLVELPSPQAGTIGALLAEEGQTVEVGAPIVEFGQPGTGAPATPGAAEAATPGTAEAAVRGTAEAPAGQAPAASESSSEGAESGPNLVGYGVTASSAKRRPRRSAGAAPVNAAPVSAPDTGSASRPQAKPPVRKLAKDRGVDLAAVTPTGRYGEVTRADVLAHLDGAAAGAGASVPVASGEGAADAARAGATDVAAPADAAAPAAVPQDGAEERIPLRGVGRMMARAMVESAFTAPHVTEFLDVDVTATMDYVRELKRTGGLGEGVKVSPLVVLSKAVCWAVARTPRINAVLEGDEIVVKHYVNLGIAAATPRGLIVPNIKGAHTMGLGRLAGELGMLIDTARAGRTSPAEQSGGTITVTNVGVFGVDAGTPIINPGESAIVAFGSVKKRPWVVDDELCVREVATLSVSADHRVVDGEAISLFLADVGRALEDPRIMLT